MLHTVQDMHIMYYALVAVLEKASAMRGGGSGERITAIAEFHC
jgi:hypothetical protein